MTSTNERLDLEIYKNRLQIRLICNFIIVRLTEEREDQRPEAYVLDSKCRIRLVSILADNLPRCDQESTQCVSMLFIGLFNSIFDKQ